MSIRTVLKRVIAISIVTSLASGCALISLGTDKHVRDKDDKKASFVYGVLDMEDAPSWAPWVILRRVTPKTKHNEWIMRVHEGVMYMENLPEGTYEVTKFGGSWGNTAYTYSMPSGSDNVTTFKISKPGVHYIGNFRYVDTVDDKRYRGSGFSLQPVKRNKLAPLKDIVDYVEGTSWEKDIKKKLKNFKEDEKKKKYRSS